MKLRAGQQREKERQLKQEQLAKLEEALERTMIEFKTILANGGETSVIHAHRCDIEQAIDELLPT